LGIAVTEASYTAWDDNLYEWPPPDGWYQASDGKWWPEGYGPSQESPDGRNGVDPDAVGGVPDQAFDAGATSAFPAGGEVQTSVFPAGGGEPQTSIFPAGGAGSGTSSTPAERDEVESQRPVYDELPNIDDVFGGADPLADDEGAGERGDDSADHGDAAAPVGRLGEPPGPVDDLVPPEGDGVSAAPDVGFDDADDDIEADTGFEPAGIEDEAGFDDADDDIEAEVPAGGPGLIVEEPPIGVSDPGVLPGHDPSATRVAPGGGHDHHPGHVPDDDHDDNHDEVAVADADHEHVPAYEEGPPRDTLHGHHAHGLVYDVSLMTHREHDEPGRQPGVPLPHQLHGGDEHVPAYDEAPPLGPDVDEESSGSRGVWPMVVAAVCVGVVVLGIIGYIVFGGGGDDDGGTVADGGDGQTAASSTGLGSVDQPYDFGTGVVVFYEIAAGGDQHRWVIQVLSPVTDATGRLVADGAAEPPAGEILALARVRVTYQSGPVPGAVGDLFFDAVSPSGAVFSQADHSCPAAADGLDVSASLEPAQSVEGSLCWQIPTSDLVGLKLGVRAGPAEGTVHLELS
jgi:hypothetical protein